MTTSLAVPPACRPDPRRPDPAAPAERLPPDHPPGAAADHALPRVAGARWGRARVPVPRLHPGTGQGRRALAPVRDHLRASWPSPAGCSRSTSVGVVELAAAFCYAGSAIGIAFAGDLLTVFIFWELMAIASTLVVWSAGPSARGAGLRYAAIHLLGGVLLDGRHRRRDRVDRVACLRQARTRHRAALADPGGLSHQCRRAAALGLAARRLSRELVERNGVPVGVHHQGRRLCPPARLSREPSC